MPSLMDMFQPQDAAGQPTNFGNAFANHSNSLVGLGMGLLQPYRPGESPYANALQGYMAGSTSDDKRAQVQAQLQHQMRQEKFQREQAAIANAHWQQTFDRGNTPDQVRLWNATQNNPDMREALFPKTAAVREGKVTYHDQEYPYQVDQKGNVNWLLGKPPGYGGGAAAAPPAATQGPQNPVIPGTALYWPDQQAAAAPSTTGAGGPAGAAIPPPLPGMENEPWSVQKGIRQKQLEEYAKTQAKDPQQEAQAKQSAANVLNALDTAEKQAVNKGGLLPTTGVFGSKLSSVYQPSADLEATLKTIAANVSLDKLSAMRAASTAGASGLGAVTEGEHALLQASIAAVNQSQSQDQLVANLKRVRATYDWIINRTDKNQPPPFVMSAGQGATTGTALGGGGTTKSGIKWTVQ